MFVVVHCVLNKKISLKLSRGRNGGGIKPVRVKKMQFVNICIYMLFLLWYTISSFLGIVGCQKGTGGWGGSLKTYFWRTALVKDQHYLWAVWDHPEPGPALPEAPQDRSQHRPAVRGPSSSLAPKAAAVGAAAVGAAAVGAPVGRREVGFTEAEVQTLYSATRRLNTYCDSKDIGMLFQWLSLFYNYVYFAHN